MSIDMSSMPPELLAVMNMSHEQAQEVMKTFERLANESWQNTLMQEALSRAMNQATKAVEKEVKIAMDWVLNQRAQVLSDLRRTLGDRTETISPAGNYPSPHQALENWRESSGYEPHFNNNGSDPLDRLRTEHPEIYEMLAEDVTSEDVDNFLDALGEVSEQYRADAMNMLEKHEHQKHVKEIMGRVDDYQAAYAQWVTDYNNAVANDQPPPPMPRLNQFVTTADRDYLQDHGVSGVAPVDISAAWGNSGSNEENRTIDQAAANQIAAALTESEAAYQASINQLIENRHTSPITADDANPENGNQFPGADSQSATMGTAMSQAGAALAGDSEADEAEAIVADL